MNKIYLLAFDPHKTDASGLHNIISKNPYITTWWHYIGSVYLIKSSYTLATIHSEIVQKWPNQHFLFIEVNASNANGWLPQEAWDWINLHK